MWMLPWKPFEIETADTAVSESRRVKIYENKSYYSDRGTVSFLALPVFFGYNGLYGVDPVVGICVNL